MFPMRWANAVIGSRNCREVTVKRSEKKSSMMDQGGRPKESTDDFLKVFSARLLL